MQTMDGRRDRDDPAGLGATPRRHAGGGPGSPGTPASEVVPCPTCGGPARLIANPYYGVGLSLHPHVLTCTACRTSIFVPRPRPSRETPGPARRRGFRGLFRR
ncbi:hypothetical protein EDF38_1960 [Frigoribacterium sp. PhB160]|nr:hypothetical protein EDF38_1960 [Frigoribacterium sp. PhB160]